ncbi:MAG: hypothetical protein LPH21_18175 [Shewanella sp.]|nr:hypothetical protein [Shewanella sp.]
MTPLDLADHLLERLRYVDKEGHRLSNGDWRPGDKLLRNAFRIDDPNEFVDGSIDSAPVAGVAYVNSAPYGETTRAAGVEIVTFVILIAVETSGITNADASTALELLYALQEDIHGRDPGLGRPWQWSGHGLVPADGNESYQIYQQTWTVLHGFTGYIK